MNKFIVLDNVLPSRDFEELRESEWERGHITWYDRSNGQSQCDQLLQIAGEHYDLSSIAGYEVWCNNTHIDWHCDIDDTLNRETGIIKYPICTLVYYLDIEVFEGGDLVTSTVMVQPIPNRLVIFGPAVRHAVRKYEGKRRAISINPWIEIPKKYENSNVSIEIG